MGVSVMVFEVVFINNGKQGNNNPQDGSGMEEESDPSILYPACSCINVFSPGSSPIAIRAHQRGDERSNDNEMAEIADEIMEHPAKVIRTNSKIPFVNFLRLWPPDNRSGLLRCLFCPDDLWYGLQKPPRTMAKYLKIP